jgi:large subunit ribosomal protein L12
MEYVYAAMLLHKAGKEISENSVSNVLKAAGIAADTVRVKAIVASLSEVDIEEAIKSAPTMMAAPATAQATAEEKKPKKEEKKPEDDKEKEDAALEGLGALFG